MIKLITETRCLEWTETSCLEWDADSEEKIKTIRVRHDGQNNITGTALYLAPCSSNNYSGDKDPDYDWSLFLKESVYMRDDDLGLSKAYPWYTVSFPMDLYDFSDPEDPILFEAHPPKDIVFSYKNGLSSATAITIPMFRGPHGATQPGVIPCNDLIQFDIKYTGFKNLFSYPGTLNSTFQVELRIKFSYTS